MDINLVKEIWKWIYILKKFVLGIDYNNYGKRLLEIYVILIGMCLLIFLFILYILNFLLDFYMIGECESC